MCLKPSATLRSSVSTILPPEFPRPSVSNSRRPIRDGALKTLARSEVVAANVIAYLDSGPRGPFDVVFCDPPFADVGIAEATLGHDALRSAVAPGGLIVMRAHGKHVPAVPASVHIARVKEIGEEKLLFLRYGLARRRPEAEPTDDDE